MSTSLFVERCIASGMSSGEGLIAEVADNDRDDDEAAAGDKRKLIVEGEFAQMKVLARKRNTLSPVIRRSPTCSPATRTHARSTARSKR